MYKYTAFINIIEFVIENRNYKNDGNNVLSYGITFVSLLVIYDSLHDSLAAR